MPSRQQMVLAEKLYRISYNPDRSRTWHKTSESCKWKYLKMAEAAIEFVANEMDKIGQCEGGCDEPVYTHDSEGVPVCKPCWDMLRKEYVISVGKVL